MLETTRHYSKNVVGTRSGDITSMNPEEAEREIMDAVNDPKVERVSGPQDRKQLKETSDSTIVYYQDGKKVIYTPYKVNRVK